MAPLRVGFIGTGPNSDKPSGLGYGMANQHAAAYQALPEGEVQLEIGRASCRERV